MKNENKNKAKASKLEQFALFYEHTDDNRVIVDRQFRPIKKLRRSIVSRR